MPSVSKAILLAAVVILGGSRDVAGQQEPLRDVVSAEWDRYKEGLKEYQFRKTKSHYNLLTGKERLNYLTVEHKHRAAWKLTRGESKEGRCSVVAMNSHYAFSLEKDKDTSSWRVGEIDLDLSNGVQIRGMGRRDLMDDFSDLYSPYILGENGFLPTFLKRPGFSVTKTESVEGQTKVWFTVVADEISANQTTTVPIEGKGWLLLDPKSHWRIKEFDLPFLSPRFEKFRAIAKYEYNMTRDNYPLLKQVDIAYYPPELSEKPMTRTVIDFSFEKRVPSETEFRLSGFGFPEPIGAPPVESGTRWYLWISLGAVCSLVFGFLFMKLAQRHQSPQATTG